MGKLIDLTGQRFGRLVVEEFAYVDKHGNAIWRCKCDCGNLKTVGSREIRKGITKSCGCLRKENLYKCSWRHGGKHTRLYTIWVNMIARIENENERDYRKYGGRGIKICEEWRNDFQQFYNWAMNHGYRDDLTIDRIDVNGHYCPENCRWIPLQEQYLNMRKNVRIEYRGENLTLAEWSRKLNINRNTLWTRIQELGWTAEKAIETPVDRRKSHKKK